MEILAPEIKGGEENKQFYPYSGKKENDNGDRRGSTGEDLNPPSKLDDSQPGPDSNEIDGSEGNNNQNKLPSLEDQIKSGEGEFNFV